MDLQLVLCDLVLVDIDLCGVLRNKEVVLLHSFELQSELFVLFHQKLIIPLADSIVRVLRSKLDQLSAQHSVLLLKLLYLFVFQHLLLDIVVLIISVPA